MVEIRPATASDLPFLAEMLVEAAYPPDLQPRPSGAEALVDPRVGRYLEGWGREGDLGLIAVAAGGERIGASWCRRFSAQRPGHGFVDAQTPELAIAVADGWRGRGVGTLLLAGLLTEARGSGYRAVSLSVSRRNERAMRLYEQLGFRVVGGDDAHPTMVRDL